MKVSTGLPGIDCRDRIPRHYSTQMQVMINTLNDMPVSADTVSGSHGIGVLMSNSLMFQRFPNHDGYDDPRFSNFYGQTLPLVKRGIPTEIVHIENTGYPETWKELKVLVMSYSNMKPQEPALSSVYRPMGEKWWGTGILRKGHRSLSIRSRMVEYR